MEKYKVLLNVLDKLSGEAPINFRKYHPDPHDQEKVNHARATSLIHLYLLVGFGLLTFEEREIYITDGSDDAGIDGYYIDKECKVIYFIQSKFRASAKNFEQKTIELKELLSMEIDRVLDGYDTYENGQKFNGKIRQFLKEIRGIDDIGRYRYEVVLLANIRENDRSKLRRLFGYPVKVFNFEKMYSELLFPVISGMFYNASDLNININLSNKNSGAKISYSVETELEDCEITVLFVPTIEIARLMLKYKNAILKYNPRCYLDLKGSPINVDIKTTMEKSRTNEFALFNNGITMLSDETFFNEKIGRKDLAVLQVRNPQIINGGQTAYTLARLLEETTDDNIEKIFGSKEVLLKVITFVKDDVDKDRKLELIESISNATNRQNIVTYADRHSNDRVQLRIQNDFFSRLGLFYERKRGEFSDGLRRNFIREEQILERNVFVRVAQACNGKTVKGEARKVFKSSDLYEELFCLEKLDHYYTGYLVYHELLSKKEAMKKKRNYKNVFKYGVYQLVYIIDFIYQNNKNYDIPAITDIVIKRVPDFEKYAIQQSHNRQFFKERFYKKTQERQVMIDFRAYYSHNNVLLDLRSFFHDLL